MKSDLLDQEIMEALFQYLKENTGYPIRKNPPEDDVETYVLAQRVNTISIDSFRKNLQLQFDVVSDDFVQAHDLANHIADLVSEWYGETDLNIMGESPLINGMVDGSNNEGVFSTALNIQIGYLVS